MSKIDIGLILGKSFTVIKKQPFILIPFLILAFLSAGFTILTFSYTAEMMYAFESFSGYEYGYEMYSPNALEELTSLFFGMGKLFIFLITGSLILWLIQILLYTGTVSVVMDVLEGRETGIGSFINVTIFKGITALLSTLIAYIVVFFPTVAGIFIFLIGLLRMSEAAFFISAVFFIIQFLWLLAILYLLSSKIPRIIYIIITAITFAFVILGIFFMPLLIIALLPLFLLFILVMISMLIISFAIDYIIPSAVVIDNSGATDALKKSYLFAKNHTINSGLLIFTINSGLLIFIAIVISIIIITPFEIFSVMMQAGDVMSGDFYTQEPVYLTTADLIISVIETFVITGIVSPFIFLMFVLMFVNAARGKEILEKLK